MVAARVLAPHTKLATTRWWHTTTLAEEFGVVAADEDDLYAAMDWLLERQGAIEHKLAARHLSEGALALYDLSSSYFEGHVLSAGARSATAATARRISPQVNYGLLTTRQGCPVAISVYEGNTADATTLMPQVKQLREQFGLERLVLVGDRGMISHKAIDSLRSLEGLAWITALKSAQIRALAQGGTLQLGLFDERNLFEFSHPDFPGERLIACRNAELGQASCAQARGVAWRRPSWNSRRCATRVDERLTRRARQDRRAGRASAQQVQSRQALRAHHRRARL